MWAKLFGRKKNGIAGFLKWVRSQEGKIRLLHDIEPREPVYGDFGPLHRDIISLLRKRGIEKLYSHQSRALSLALSGSDIVVVTPTASGKTLCYVLPVIDSILKNNKSRAILLFPTKALAQDQRSEIRELISELKIDIPVFTYDGDTPRSDRKKARESASVIISNPDMLNAGILPHHRSWEDFFRNLDFIVVDELHSYRGVLGSHLSNLFVRMLRICRFYGSNPVFICCSATIANPFEHAMAITGRPAEVIDENGAPSPQKELVIYDPKLIDRKRGLRRSSLYEAARFGDKAFEYGLSSVIFTRSRINVELILQKLSDFRRKSGISGPGPRGYRSGYLPSERREIEGDLRRGKLKTVVSTNALELGVDIGSLELVLIHGFPGSMASLWQQIGRAGRRSGSSAAVIIPTGLPSDRYLADNPEILLGALPEAARIDPANPYIRIDHIKCSAYEIPFRADELFGGDDITGILKYLAEHGVLSEYQTPEGLIYLWSSEGYPASSFSLRSASADKYSIYDNTDGEAPSLIGTIDKRSAGSLIFPGAVYFHDGKTYSVEELDRESMSCLVKRSSPKTFTEARPTVRIRVKKTTENKGIFGWGESVIFCAPGIYKTIDLKTRETLGHGSVELAEEKTETTSAWITVSGGLASLPGIRIAMSGTANLIKNLAPLFLMCDAGDISVFTSTDDPYFAHPAILISDSIPGGVGLAEGVYSEMAEILAACIKRLDSCGCKNGCPSCTGIISSDPGTKKMTRMLLKNLIEQASAIKAGKT